MVIRTQSGLGDCLYLRPVIRWIPRKLYLETPWPQAFIDIPGVSFIRPWTRSLRTQQDNVDRFSDWENLPAHLPDAIMSYSLEDGKTILSRYCQNLLWHQPNFFDNSLTIRNEWKNDAVKLIDYQSINKPICLLRPNTIRPEWACPARNPKTEYLQKFIDTYRDDFYIITLANLDTQFEWYDGYLKGMHLELTKDVSTEQVFGLFYLSSMIVCSPSFWVPLSMALEKPTIAIYGAHFPHELINDTRIKNPNMRVLQPKPFDTCHRTKLDAYKDIDPIELTSAFKEVTDRAKNS